MTAEMLYSKAWGALPADAIKFIMRVVAEHLKHGGVANGKLPVTYGDLNKIGLHNDKARRAILVAIELGFIDKGPQLVRPRNIRAPNLYGLTWLPTCDGSPPTNRWTRFQDRDGALMAVRRAKAAASLNRRRDTGTNRTRTSLLRT